MTREILAGVFRVQADVIADPVSGVPICLPYHTLDEGLEVPPLRQNGHA